MKKFFKSNFFKKTAKILSLTSVAFVFQACYGVPNELLRDRSVSGKVLNEHGEPLPDIDIAINGVHTLKSNTDGDFYIYIPIEESYNCTFSGTEQYDGRDTLIMDEGSSIRFNFKLKNKAN